MQPAVLVKCQCSPECEVRLFVADDLYYALTKGNVEVLFIHPDHPVPKDVTLYGSYSEYNAYLRRKKN